MTRKSFLGQLVVAALGLARLWLRRFSKIFFLFFSHGPGAVCVRKRRWLGARPGKLVLAAALLTVSSGSHAAPGWSTPFMIQSFIPTDTGLKLVVSGNDNLVGCSSPSWISINKTDPNFDLISSALLTAFVQGKAAKVWESYCDTDGSIRIAAGWIDR